MKSQSVEFTEAPRVEEYGTVVVFKDLYGTKWDLLQLKQVTKWIEYNAVINTIYYIPHSSFTLVVVVFMVNLDFIAILINVLWLR